jgi:hypothetical protein
MAVSLTNATNSTNILNIPYTASNLQPHTVMCWVYLDGTTPVNYRDVLVMDPNIYMQSFSDGITMDFGTNNFDHNVLLFQPNTWYHVTGVYVPTSASSREIYGYINGDLRLKVTNTDTFLTYTNICIGNSITFNYAHPLNGSIRDVRIWDRELDPSDILLETNSAIPVNNLGLIIWAPFDDNLILDKGSLDSSWSIGSSAGLKAGPLKPFNKIKRPF